MARSLALLLVFFAAGCAGEQAIPAGSFTNTLGMKLVLMPAGEYLMGSPDSDPDANNNEKPQHRVRITKPFYIGAHEVTRGQFAKFVAATNYRTDVERTAKGGEGYDETGDFDRKPEYSWRNIGLPQTDEHPVVNVSWNDAKEFCRWLGGKEGKTYDLPTEAQWEYACRAGTTTRFHNGDDLEGLAVIGNVIDRTGVDQFPRWRVMNSLQARDGHAFIAPVGCYQPNNAGLYDMSGNVWEWCSDAYDRDFYKTSPVDDPVSRSVDPYYRTIRGGAFDYGGVHSRSANRDGGNSAWDVRRGFRVIAVP